MQTEVALDEKFHQEAAALFGAYDEWCRKFDPEGQYDTETLARFYDLEARAIRAERTLEVLEAAGHINSATIQKARQMVAKLS